MLASQGIVFVPPSSFNFSQCSGWITGPIIQVTMSQFIRQRYRVNLVALVSNTAEINVNLNVTVG